APDRSGGGSVRERLEGIPEGHVAALNAWLDRRHAAHVHPGRRRLHQRAAARDASTVHDRERHPVAIPGDHRLPDRGGALVRADGTYPRRDLRLRPGDRDGEADRMTAAAERIPIHSGPRVATRLWRFVRHHVLTVYALLAFAYLLVPIAIVILFSF